jgi:hypothetical protein
VGVGADDGAGPPVEVDAEGVLLARQLAVEVDDADRRQRLRGLSTSRSKSVKGFSMGIM